MANKYEKMVAEVTEQIQKMTVAQLRKEAIVYGIKNPKQYKRAQLVQKVIEGAIQFHKEQIEKQEQSNKRYKAVKLESNDQIEAIANDIIAYGFARDTDPYKVNRKVLIVVMKKLKCPKWYRTYDKPTMLAMIKQGLESKTKKEE